MLFLIAGIALFLGAHSLNIAPGGRAVWVGKLGEGPYKGLYSLLSAAGLGLIIYGFGRYRAEGWVQIWTPPIWTRHITLTLMWVAFVCLAAAGKAPGRIRGWLRHPMLVGVKTWALAHLLANGDLGGMILFGSFLAWAVADRISVKRRGDAGAARVARFTRADAVALGGGTVAYVAMLFLHPYLIGVAVLG
jgi:uncharacterized membrane protein